jgi:hypothetical protein
VKEGEGKKEEKRRGGEEERRRGGEEEEEGGKDEGVPEYGTSTRDRISRDI